MKSLAVLAFAAGLMMTGGAHAATVVVDAAANSSSGGVGAFAGNVALGDALTVTVDPGDLWNAGALPRWSNADGLTGNLVATGSDDSGESAGTLIGVNFGTHSQDGFSAPFGTLVGRIGTVWQSLGTSFAGTAWGTGALNLYYWDSNFGDNSEFVTAKVAIGVVPEPGTWALLIGGFGLAGAALRRQRRRGMVSAA